ncbi:MAG TPA: lipoate--protein ligase family protein [Abditibacteriaceae bacterium]
MKLLDLTYPSPEENLACEEVLLDWCERGECGEILRFSQPDQTFAVVGYTEKVQREMDVAACRADGIRILRRTSGGGSVLQGRGCFAYSLFLDMRQRLALGSVTEANRFIMETQRDALARLSGRDVQISGYTDLAIDGRKISGNAQRRKQKFLLFHGTLLLDFDLSLIARYLQFPSKQPDYRAGRRHEEFVTNLHLPAESVKVALAEAWSVEETDAEFAVAKLNSEVHALAAEKYSRDEWNFKL